MAQRHPRMRPPDSDGDLEEHLVAGSDRHRSGQPSASGIFRRIEEFGLYRPNGDGVESAGRRNHFAKASENASRKAEFVFVGIEVVALLLYQVVLSRPSGVWFWMPMSISIAARSLSIVVQNCLARIRCKVCPYTAAAFCMLFDVVLFTSIHPDVQDNMPWGVVVPDAPLQACDLKCQGIEDFHDRGKCADTCHIEHNSMMDIQRFELLLTTYCLQIWCWYVVSFVLLRRQSLFVMPLVCISYCSMVFFFRDHDRRVPHSRLLTLEFAVFIFSMLIALCAKVHQEATQRKAFDLAEERCHEVVREKVMRFQAETTRDELTIRFAGPLQNIDELDSSGVSVSTQPWTPSLSSPAAAPATSSLTKQRKPASLRSAPAASLKFLDAFTGCSAKSKGDCLPPGAMVWVEGQSMPQPVADVNVGQRVLCYDNLGRCPRFADVISSRILGGEARWVSVTLADGATVTMTANHPVQPQRRAPGSVRGWAPLGGPAVCAQELRPGEDGLVVMKMVPVAVESVQSVDAFPSADGAGSDEPLRVALSLNQPERHEVLVAPPGTASAAGIAPTVAVGSADAHVTSLGERAVGLVVRRTFLDVAESSPSSIRRSSSAPPSFAAEEPELTERGVSAARASIVPEKPDELTEPHGRRGRLRLPSLQGGGLRRTFSASDFSSFVSSEDSRRSMQDDKADILVGGAIAAAGTPACVGDFLRAKRAGLASLGSAGHSEGRCTICVFQNQHQHNGKSVCFKGLLCSRCHECHPPIAKKKRKSGAMQRLDRAKAEAEKRIRKDSGSDTEEADGWNRRWADA